MTHTKHRSGLVRNKKPSLKIMALLVIMAGIGGIYMVITSLAATTTTATPAKVDLTWPGATDNGSPASGIKGYYVYRNGAVISALVPHTTAASYTYTDNDVPIGSHSYTVRSVDNAGLTSTTSSPPYNTTINAPADTIKPTAPGNVAASAISSSQINLSWTASTDQGGSGLSGYNIYRGTSATAISTKINTSLVASTSFGDTGLNAGTTYYYQVEAVDGAGNTAKSSPVSATPGSKQGDINGDGSVNIFDLSILLSNYGKPASQASDPDCDLNGNGTVDIFDLSILLSKYGT